MSTSPVASGRPGALSQRGVPAGVHTRTLGIGLMSGAIGLIVWAALTIEPSPGRSRNPGAIVTAVLACALLLLGWRALSRWLTWYRLGLRIDDGGLTVGDVGPPRSRPVVAEALTLHSYAAPWSAVYDARIIETPADIARACKQQDSGRVPGGRVVAPRRPAYFPARGHPLFMCRVDPAQVRWPELPHAITASLVWAIPIRDPDAVAAAVQAHGIAVARQASALKPTTPGAMALQDLSRDPVYLTAARYLRGPVPPSHAALEAAMVRDLGVPPYLT